MVFIKEYTTEKGKTLDKWFLGAVTLVDGYISLRFDLRETEEGDTLVSSFIRFTASQEVNDILEQAIDNNVIGVPMDTDENKTITF